jgi:ABC-type molybdate transport system substrate-binding protein
VFRKAELVRAGSRARLETKALKLTGAADSPQPPAGSSTYGWHLREGRADLFLGYCTATRLVESELPGARSIELPNSLATGAEYGLTLIANSAVPQQAARLAFFILSAEGQAILARHGFDAPLAPAQNQ